MDRVPEKCYKCRDLTVTVQFAGTIILTILKLYVGIVGNSKVMIADSLHSASNIGTAFALSMSKKWSGKPENEGYPYGYGKVEFLISGVVGVVIIVMGIILLWTSVGQILHQRISTPPSLMVIAVAVISVLVNEILYHYLHCVGKQFNNSVMRSNSLALRADSLTSLVVIVSVIAANLGFPRVDPLAALIIVGVLLVMGAKCVIESSSSLMDKSIPIELRRKMIELAEEIESVRVKGIKARFVGSKIWANLDIMVGGNPTIEEFDQIALQVKKNVLNSNELIEKVFVGYDLC